MRLSSRFAFVLTLVVAITTLGLDIPVAGAAVVECGEVITTSIVLQEDLTDCPWRGLVIGADDVTIDLNGHVIDGPDEPLVCLDENPPPPPPDCEPGTEGCEGGGETECERLEETFGIDNRDGYERVTIKNGTVQQFFNGVHIEDSHGNRLLDLVISGAPTCPNDVTLLDSNDNIVQGSVFNGMRINGDANLVTNNDWGGRCVDPGVGIIGSHNRVEENRVHWGTLNITGNSNTLYGNVIDSTESHPAILIIGESSDNIVESNRVTRSGVDSGGTVAGIAIVSDFEGIGPGNGNALISNVIQLGGGNGIFVEEGATGTLISRNRVMRNAGDGIHVAETDSTLVRNLANRNGDLGIEAAFGVEDGGGNVAHGNGDPRECLNVECH